MRCMHRNPMTVVLVLASLAAVPAHAMHPSRTSEACLDDHEKAVSDHPVAIPDNDPRGVRLGPLSTRSQGLLEDVVLAISLTHPNTADVTMMLEYDADHDGTPDAGCPVEIYLARQRPCTGTESWACPIELAGTYYFMDRGWRDCGETATFDVFTGLEACGDWYLSIVDNAPGEMGTVSGWEVFTVTERDGTEPAGERAAACQ